MYVDTSTIETIPSEGRPLIPAERAAVSLVRAERWLSEVAGTDHEDAAYDLVKLMESQFHGLLLSREERATYLGWAELFTDLVTP